MLASTRPSPPRLPISAAPVAGTACASAIACAIVRAVITGNVTSTARTSRCNAATSAAALPDVRASTVVGSAPDCAHDT
ncbi:hypothetical protein D3C83_11710 [compost metagenome]